MQYRVRSRSRPPAPTPKVGYGNPPVETRWKPGMSGNPGGRPKKKLIIDPILEKTFRKVISITRDGNRTRMSQLAALLETTMVDAIKGDNTARKIMLNQNTRRELAAAIREETERQETPAELDPADQEILNAFRREILKDAKKKQNGGDAT